VYPRLGVSVIVDEPELAGYGQRWGGRVRVVRGSRIIRVLVSCRIPVPTLPAA
jgi:hypothetical protein